RGTRQWTYYRCARSRAECGRRAATEATLVAGALHQLRRLGQSPERLQWMRVALLRSMEANQSQHDAELVRLRALHEQLERRIRAAYADHIRRLEESRGDL